jgi:hypothetical protein
MSTITVVNGLVTGGGCISDGAGGSSGHTIASGTTSGGSVAALAGTLPSRATMYFDAAGFDLYDDSAAGASIIKAKNMQTVASTQTVGISATWTATTFGTCIDGSTVSVITGNNKAVVSFSGYLRNTLGVYTYVSYLIDGAFATNTSSTKGLAGTYDPTATAPESVSFSHITDTLSAGSHSFCITAAVSGGTGSTGDAGTTPDSKTVFSVQELATGGQGFSQAFSTYTDISGVSRISGAANTFSGVTQSSLTFTSNGTPGFVEFDGQAYADGATYMTFGVYLNGVLQTNALGYAKGQQVYTDAIGITFPISFRVPITPASGSNTISLAYAAGANFTATFSGWGASSVQRASARFGFREDRNAAGTGDVSSNGTNVWSGVQQGTWTFAPGMGYSGLAGGIVTSSVGVSGATSTPLTFDGTRYRRVRVVVEGTLAAAADATISLLRFNNDSGANYIASGGFNYSGGSGGIPEQTTGVMIWRAAGTTLNQVEINIYCRTSVLGTARRTCQMQGGGNNTTIGWSITGGGSWSDASTAVSSLNMIWGSAFTGNVYVYQD